MMSCVYWVCIRTNNSNWWKDIPFDRNQHGRLKKAKNKEQVHYFSSSRHTWFCEGVNPQRNFNQLLNSILFVKEIRKPFFFFLSLNNLNWLSIILKLLQKRRLCYSNNSLRSEHIYLSFHHAQMKKGSHFSMNLKFLQKEGSIVVVWFKTVDNPPFLFFLFLRNKTEHWVDVSRLCANLHYDLLRITQNVDFVEINILHGCKFFFECVIENTRVMSWWLASNCGQVIRLVMLKVCINTYYVSNDAGNYGRWIS